MLIYQYSGGLDGFLSAVFLAYETKSLPDLITDGILCEPPLASEIIPVSADEEKARRIERGIFARMGMDGLYQLSYAYASCDPEKNRKLFYWILSVFKYGSAVQKRFQDPNVMDFCDMTARVTLEIHRAMGFLRFVQSEGGIFCAEFAPDNNVLTFLMPHFTRRFSDQSFLIQDTKRSLYGIYNGTEWKVLYSEKKIAVTPSEPEKAFQMLWKEYYRSASIVSRENKRLQNSFLPQRYRTFLTEFQP